MKDPELKEEAHEKFREIQEAYEILSELKKKRAKQNIKAEKVSGRFFLSTLLAAQ